MINSTSACHRSAQFRRIRSDWYNEDALVGGNIQLEAVFIANIDYCLDPSDNCLHLLVAPSFQIDGGCSIRCSKFIESARSQQIGTLPAGAADIGNHIGVLFTVTEHTHQQVTIGINSGNALTVHAYHILINAGKHWIFRIGIHFRNALPFILGIDIRPRHVFFINLHHIVVELCGCSGIVVDHGRIAVLM